MQTPAAYSDNVILQISVQIRQFVQTVLRIARTDNTISLLCLVIQRAWCQFLADVSATEVNCSWIFN